jgi:UDP-2-acetamido-3-amino-2,3-dideoxy-glucuronate N-acetyltransferase
VRRSIYETTTIRKGATIGAIATIVCGVTIGQFAFVAAGAVVTKSIPDYGLVKGSPAKLSGWMSRHGHVLEFDQQGQAVCPVKAQSEEVRCLDISEQSSLPQEKAVGQRSYRDVRASRS